MNIKNLIAKHGKPEREVYFDSENSGFIPKEVLDEMLPYFNMIGYGHPAITNLPGWQAYDAVESARDYIKSIINADPEDTITFTHSGTEANNLAIFGTVLANKDGRNKIIISAIEHQSVLFPATNLKDHGYNVQVIPVDDEGFVDTDILDLMVDRSTLLVSIQAVNQEIGTVQNLKEIVEIIRDKNPNIIIHSDAADAFGRIKFDVKKLDIDLLTISSHKILGPKGVGGLYIRNGITIKPIIYGALSTQRLWPGVENVPAIVGFKKAVELAYANFEDNVKHMMQLRDHLLNGILNSIDDVILNGPLGDKRAPDNVNVSFLYIEGEAITVELSLRGIYVSSGSACTSRTLEPSHVMLAIGRKHEEAHGSILFKVTRYHSGEDITYTLEQIQPAISRLRYLSPISPEKYKEGIVLDKGDDGGGGC